jgi:polysaccharide transporter, PST family
MVAALWNDSLKYGGISRSVQRYRRGVLKTRLAGLIRPAIDLLRHGGVQRIVQNAGWLVAEKFLVLAVNLAVMVWVARYLGPSQFGILNYGIAFAALFGFLSYLGLDGVVTHELVRSPGQKEEILGTALALRFAGGAVAAAAIVAVMWYRPGDAATKWVTIVIGIGLIFDSFDVFDFWFQSRVEAKYPALARTASVLVSSAVKVVLILTGAPLIAFAFATLLQHVVKAAGLGAWYMKKGHSMRWRARQERTVALLRQSWPLILSGASAVLYLKIDQVMLGEIVGRTEVGIYAVAVRFSEVWYFIPNIIAASIFPALIKSKERDQATYNNRLQRMYGLMVWIGFGLALFVTVVATPLIRLLYGAPYARAGAILAVHIWTCPAVFMAAILSKWLIVEKLTIFSLTRHAFGAAVNIGLNLLLIPRYGGMGAAVATLLSYTTASYLACFTDRRTRGAGIMMTRAIFQPVRSLRPANDLRVA